MGVLVLVDDGLEEYQPKAYKMVGTFTERELGAAIEELVKNGSIVLRDNHKLVDRRKQ